MTKIHETSIIDKGAKLAKNVEIGPYSIIGDNVEIGGNTKIHSHVVIKGPTVIGKNNEVYPFASIGDLSQDIKSRFAKVTGLIIGDNNVFREYTTAHQGTPTYDEKPTKIGNNNNFLMHSHIAHDCELGDDIIMSNNATLAGHVVVEDSVVIGGFAGVHQFCKVGKHAMIGAMAKVTKNVIPYGMIDYGAKTHLAGLNFLGLERRGYSKYSIEALRDAYKKLFVSNEDVFKTRLEKVVSEYKNNKDVMYLINFIEEKRPAPYDRPFHTTQG